MSVSASLLSEMRSIKPGEALDWRALREKIHDAFDQTDSFEERGIILAAFTALMDCVERGLEDQRGDPGDLATFRKTRDQDYCLLLTKESLDGENVDAKLLERATKREVDAGRMSPDHQLRKLALVGTTLGISTAAQPGKAASGKVSWWKRLTGRSA